MSELEKISPVFLDVKASTDLIDAYVLLSIEEE